MSAKPERNLCIRKYGVRLGVSVVTVCVALFGDRVITRSYTASVIGSCCKSPRMPPRVWWREPESSIMSLQFYFSCWSVNNQHITFKLSMLVRTFLQQEQTSVCDNDSNCRSEVELLVLYCILWWSRVHSVSHVLCKAGNSTVVKIIIYLAYFKIIFI